MKIKNIIRWLPNWLVFSIIITTIISSFDGVVLAQVLSSIANFNHNSTFLEVMFYAVKSFSAMAIVYFSMTLRKMLINLAIKKLNVKLKSNFIYGQINTSTFSSDTADNVSKIFNDFKLVETDYFSLMFEVFASLLMALISGIYILSLSIPIGILFILFSLLPMITPKIFGKKLTATSSKWQEDSSRFLSKVTDLFNGANTIKTYLAEKYMYNDTDKYLNESENSYLLMNNWQAVTFFVASILSVVSYILPIGIGLLLVIQRKISSAALIGIFMASDRVVGPLGTVSEYLSKIKTTQEIRKSYSEHMIEFKAPKKISKDIKPKICFENVYFTYSNGKQIINNLNLNITFGEKILITGASGVGKSTILNLIQGSIKPSSGKIYLREKNRKINNILESGRIAYIRQNPNLFNDTLRFNLTLGEDFSTKDCLFVLEKVGLINELGNDALNRYYGESGKNLSGGQRQRIEIARALLFNKKIILIDEATSSLDPKMSDKINKIIQNLDCTVIEVAHYYDDIEFKHAHFTHYVLENKTLRLNC